MRELTISPTYSNSFENNHTNQRNASTLAVKYVKDIDSSLIGNKKKEIKLSDLLKDDLFYIISSFGHFKSATNPENLQINALFNFLFSIKMSRSIEPICHLIITITISTNAIVA